MEKPFIIGIAGSSGSGKTFFLKSFLNRYPADSITLISQDDYYIPANTKTREENRLYNFDLPTAIDRTKFFQDIQDLCEGKTVYKREYTFNNPKIRPRTLEIKPASILIVEGLFIFHYNEVNELLDYRIFLDAEESVALERRLKRDLIERGYNYEDVMYKWQKHVAPAFQQYLLPYKNACDAIIINNSNDPAVIGEASKMICKNIQPYVNL